MKYALIGLLLLLSGCAWVGGMWRFATDPCCTEENRPRQEIEEKSRNG